MQNQQYHTSSIKNNSLKSSFHKSSQAFLIKYLQNQFQYDHQLATCIIQTHNCLTIAQLMDLFLTDQNGLYSHLFIKNISSKCKICGQSQNMHKLSEIQSKKLQQKSNFKFQQQHQNYQSISFNQKLKNNIKQNKKLCEVCYLVKLQGKLHQVCLSCMNEYLKYEINNSQVQNMRCPHCGDALTPDQIKGFVDNITFTKYQSFLRNLEIQKNPNLRWCPNPKCSIVLKTNKNKKTIKCHKCQTLICMKCNRQAHPRKSCNSVFKSQIKNWEDASDIQKCKKCKALVQKISGCNHMSCSVCRYEWCWLCGSTYSQAHFNPLNPFGCPGLQNTDHSNWGKCRILMWRIMMFMLILILLPILLPLAVIGVGPGIIMALLLQKYYYFGYFRKFLIIIFSIIVGLVLDPVVWIVGILYGIPKGISLLIKHIKRRREINRYSDDLLKRRFLRQADNQDLLNPLLV